uniref:Uncharacterized protein n=1 Tax=Coccolithus braarudii TaxID=221442 RepID=A0A6T7HM06_9EUKA|mmetsp:Transcript_37363/g.79613  ORF Transcript_37363/g.79613 Transcript_37363/m.79613 type:complete len:521 (+) Transcript_37363:133-1695(+)
MLATMLTMLPATMLTNSCQVADGLLLELSDASNAIHLPAPRAMTSLIDRLKRGQGITVVATGSSITRGGSKFAVKGFLPDSRLLDAIAMHSDKADLVCLQSGSKEQCSFEAEQGWLEAFMFRLNVTFPHADNLLINLGKAGKTISYFARSLCLNTLMPNHVDMYILEHNVLSGTAADMEMLVRSLRGRQTLEPVIILFNHHWFRQCSDDTNSDTVIMSSSRPDPLVQLPSSYQNNTKLEESYLQEEYQTLVQTPCQLALPPVPLRWSLLVQHYGWGSVSMAALLQNLMDRHNLTTAYMKQAYMQKDGAHPNPRGACVMGWLLSAAWELQLLIPHVRMSRAQLQTRLPPPLIETAPRYDLFPRKLGWCIMNTPLELGARIINNTAFSHVKYYVGSDGISKYKPGWSSFTPGHMDIDLSGILFSSGFRGSSVDVSWSLLSSYQKVGKATITCTSPQACTCTDHHVTLLNKAVKASYSKIVTQNVELPAKSVEMRCILQLRSLSSLQVKLEYITMRLPYVGRS